VAIFSDSVGARCSAAKCQRSGRFLSVRPTRSNARRVAHSRRSKARPSLAAVGQERSPSMVLFATAKGR